MAFDFNALLANPAFQFGTTLLGSARQPGAIGNAYSSLQKIQELKQAQEAQKMQIEDAKQMRAVQEQRAMIAQQTEDRRMQMEERVAAAAERKQAQQDAFMQQLQGLMGGGVAPQPPQQALPPQSPTQGFQITPESALPPPQMPPQAQGGITNELLDSLAQVESSGNPRAVNPQSGAQGMYQFMPGTTRMIQQRDPGFDPFDPAKARAAAKQYLTTLTKQHGGDLEKALAAYGGFKKKDPTPYIQKVMRGAGVQQQAPQQTAPAGAPIPISGGMNNPGLDIARLGVGAGVTGLPGAAQIMDLAKLMAPQNVPAGSYQRNPQTGEMQYVQDPLATARIAQDAQRIGLDVQRNAREEERHKKPPGQVINTPEGQAVFDSQTGTSTPLIDTKSGARTGAVAERESMKATLAGMDQTINTIKSAETHKGLAAGSGMTGIAMRRIPGTAAYDFAAQVETIKSQQFLSGLRALKEQGITLGQVTEAEGSRLEHRIASLNLTQSDETIAKNLEIIRKDMEGMRNRISKSYTAKHGKQAPALPQGWSVQEVR